MTLTTLASDPVVLALFERVCALISARGEGLTLRQLSAARALAAELTLPDPDPGRVGDFAHKLELDPEELR